MADNKTAEKAEATEARPLTEVEAQAAQRERDYQLSLKPQSDWDSTTPGGRILRDGVLVNCNGEAINEDGTVKKASE